MHGQRGTVAAVAGRIGAARVGAAVCGALAALAAACSPAPTAELARASRAAGGAWLVPWGAGPGAVGRREAQPERRGESVAAVAVGPDGAVFVLDQLNRRVVRLDEPGRPPARVAAAPADAADLAVGPDGALAVYSPLQARVWVHGGADVAEMAVPRVLREARGVALGASRQVRVLTAYQETYGLGSPAAPQSLPAVLAGKREGEAFLPDGRGVAVVRRPDGRVEVVLRAAGERAPVTARLPLPGAALGGRVIGTAGSVVCVRLEESAAAPAPAFAVTRRVACVDAATGAVVLEHPLGAPGDFVPAREAAVGGTPARLAVIRPERDGLRVERLPLAAGAHEVAP